MLKHPRPESPSPSSFHHDRLFTINILLTILISPQPRDMTASPRQRSRRLSIWALRSTETNLSLAPKVTNRAALYLGDMDSRSSTYCSNRAPAEDQDPETGTPPQARLLCQLVQFFLTIGLLTPIKNPLSVSPQRTSNQDPWEILLRLHSIDTKETSTTGLSQTSPLHSSSKPQLGPPI
jgi:hypothetical protein